MMKVKTMTTDEVYYAMPRNTTSNEQVEKLLSERFYDAWFCLLLPTTVVDVRARSTMPATTEQQEKKYSQICIKCSR